MYLYCCDCRYWTAEQSMEWFYDSNGLKCYRLRNVKQQCTTLSYAYSGDASWLLNCWFHTATGQRNSFCSSLKYHTKNQVRADSFCNKGSFEYNLKLQVVLRRSKSEKLHPWSRNDSSKDGRWGDPNSWTRDTCWDSYTSLSSFERQDWRDRCVDCSLFSDLKHSTSEALSLVLDFSKLRREELHY